MKLFLSGPSARISHRWSTEAPDPSAITALRLVNLGIYRDTLIACAQHGPYRAMARNALTVSLLTGPSSGPAGFATTTGETCGLDDGPDADKLPGNPRCQSKVMEQELLGKVNAKLGAP